ncbi:MAG: translation initiation factor IF-2 [Desulfamplus sp.]|nr:translation initiation factor IF-2 [Desulfamplus sp.]
MAKIRVHELAKKLNMTNKALLTKLKAMDIEVKSHMSSLEDETVHQIKLNIFGNKQKEQDSRVGTSVIRRRKQSKKESVSVPAGERLTEQPSSNRSQINDDMPIDESVKEHAVVSSVLSPAVTSSSEISEQNMADIVSKHKQSDIFSRTETNETEFSQGQIDSDAIINNQRVPVEEIDLLEEQRQPVEKEADAAPMVPFISHKSADRDNDISNTIDSDIVERTDQTEKLGAADKNKKTGDFNIKEADMPTDSDNPKKSKEEFFHQESIDDTELAADKNTYTQQNQDDDGQDTSEETSDFAQGKDSSAGNDKKKKRKKKQKKSEPAKIIKLAEPPAPVPPPPIPKKREYVERNIGVKGTVNADRDKASPHKERAPFNREQTPSAKDLPGLAREKTSFEKTRHITPDREKIPSNRGDRTVSDRGKSLPVGRSGAKAEIPLLKVRSRKDLDTDGVFIPVEPSEKDDAKAKRIKSKVKKKKWGEDEGLGDDSKPGQKKRKSVVEGKDLYEQGFSGRKGRRKDGKTKQRPKIQKTQITVPKAIKRRIRIDETIDLSELAKRMSIKANEMIQKLMGMGIMVTVNQTIDFDTAALVAAEFDYEVEKTAVAEDMLSHAHEVDDPDKLIPRSPVVTIMGHVDHGKTSLLDVIRKSKITTGEAGGITQHIGAYSVRTPNGGIVTFLDTPGHAAFTSMRSRGAQITDLVVLVVAADDGVMPQTIEAINHSKAAGVPVVVAVNKMDKPNADPDRVMRELSDHGLLSEDWGGDVIFAKVSAKAGTGIDELLEMILLQAEVLELKADPDRLATGHVVEARLDAGRGPVATVLVQQGTLRNGQPVVCGLHSGKIRFMIDDMGKTTDIAGPSTPVEIVGLSGVPEAGDEFIALASEKDAKQISESRMQKERAKELAKKSRANLEKLFANMGSGQAKQLKLIIKTDVHGSLEALNESLMKLVQEEVDIKIVHSGTGAINESDVSLAAVSDAIIIGFNVRPTPKVREMAKDENVDMRFYDIIYNVINDIKTALTGLMPSTFHEIIIGQAEVRDLFVIPGKGTIAGCFVQDGKVARGEKIRLLRDGVIKCDSFLSSLRRFKDDAKEVTQGYECGIGIEKFNDLKVGDIIECYQIEERKASLESIKE